MTTSGLDFNTPDTLVQEYIAKFGGVLDGETCGRCHLTAQQCIGGGGCQTEGGPRKDLIQHMRELWLEIGFSPTNFKLPDRETEDQSDKNFGGDRTVLNVPSFPRTPHPASVELDKDSVFIKTKVTNFPKDISETSAVNFLKENVDESISLPDLEILRTEINSQIIIGPGPSKEGVNKAVELLDFHRSL